MRYKEGGMNGKKKREGNDALVHCVAAAFAASAD